MDRMSEDYLTWNINYEGVESGKKECSKESLLTIGNGFFGLRGSFVEAKASDDHYPATYIAGLFNQLATPIGEHEVVNEDFVNAPNGQFITFRVDDGDWFTPEQENILKCHRNLNLKTGELTINVLAAIGDGKEIRVVTKKVANMKNRHQYVISYELTPMNFSGEISVMTQIDGSIINSGVERYRTLSSRHLDVTAVDYRGNVSRLAAATIQSNIKIVTAAKLLTPQGLEVIPASSPVCSFQTVTFTANVNQSYRFEKCVAVYTSLESTGNFYEKALAATENNCYEQAQLESAESWASLWQQIDIKVTGDAHSQKLLRLHNYHLMVSASPFANDDLDASIGARGLHGEAYRGNIFWDEIFILPYYMIHFPEIAKQILMYRYRRLPAAKAYAQEHGYEGAMFPWQSGLYGDEQSQVLHLNPLSGKWGKDYSSLQRHVSLAVAYDVWYYYHVTQDQVFLEAYGLEMLLEIARFWISKATFNPATHRYDIHRVMGPNEFHDKYPNAEEGGLTNSSYTNMMLVWFLEELSLLKAALPAESFAEVAEATGFTGAHWEKVADIKRKLALDINEEGIIAQFEGFLDLQEFDWDGYREKYGNIYRLDRLLKAEGRSPNDYQVSKQADTLQAFYNLNKLQTDKIMQNLNVSMPADYLEKNLHYYLKRTSHGSTLSRIVHAQLAEVVQDRDLAWQLFSEALNSDYGDIQGGTTAEGIHTGVMAATLLVTLNTFAGVDVRQDVLTMNPNLPERWEQLEFQFKFRGVGFEVGVTKTEVKILSDADVSVKINGEQHYLVSGEWLVVSI